MAQLTYSSAKLIRRVGLGLAVTPLPLIFVMDKHFESGHVFGLWVGLLYLIGPTGRWIVTGLILGAIALSCVRMIVLLLSDRVAVYARPTGLTLQTGTSKIDLPWRDVLSLDLVAKTARGRTYEWLRIRTIGGTGEKKWQITTSLLDADRAEVQRWLTTACNLKASERTASPASRIVAAGRFGRRGSVNTR